MRASRLLLKPVFLVSLAVLIINDHYLKGAYPSFITGKLSDFSGLFVFCVFLTVIFQKYLKNRGSLLGLHIFVGICFILWKTAPVEVLFFNIQRYVPVPLPGRVKDATDLAALSILIPGFLYIARIIFTESIQRDRSFIKSVATAFLFILMTCSILATSPPMYDFKKEDIDLEIDADIAETLFIFENLMLEKGFTITSRSGRGQSKFYYYINGAHISGDSIEVGNSEFPKKIWMIIKFEIVEDMVVLEEFKCHSPSAIEDLMLNEFIEVEIIEPFKESLRDHGVR